MGKGYIHDIVKSAIIGFAAGGSMLLLSALLALLLIHGSPAGLLEFVRSGLCILGSFGFFLSAAFLLMKKSVLSEEHLVQWRKQFYRMNIAGVIFISCIMVVLLAGAVDFFMITIFGR